MSRELRLRVLPHEPCTVAGQQHHEPRAGDTRQQGGVDGKRWDARAAGGGVDGGRGWRRRQGGADGKGSLPPITLGQHTSITHQHRTRTGGTSAKEGRDARAPASDTGTSEMASLQNPKRDRAAAGAHGQGRALAPCRELGRPHDGERASAAAAC